MRVLRRTLLQGMMAGGAIAAIGLPKISLARSQAAAAREVVLVDCGGIDDGFTESTGLVRHSVGAGVLPDLTATRTLFASSRGKRLIGQMENAAYVLFSELARDAGVRLVFEGQHSATGDGRASRHIFNAAAGFHGMAEVLAAALTVSDTVFAIADVPVGTGGRVMRGGDWSRLGFESFHVADETPLWLHFAGVSRAEGCAALGLAEALTEPLHCWPTYVPAAAATTWQAALGRALTQLAGGAENRVPCVRQMFVRGAAALDEFAADVSLVSFVMEA